MYFQKVDEEYIKHHKSAQPAGGKNCPMGKTVK